MEKEQFDIDEHGTLRVMPTAKADQCAGFIEQAQTFHTKINTFIDTIGNYVEYVDKLGTKTEGEKTRAMGFRNQVGNRSESMQREKLELESMIQDRSRELQRLQAELSSLVAVEQQQQALVHSLVSMEYQE
ncbi:putative intraflagellar transport protein 20 [Blattamonas nauphoetae]|uniref:Intraflagellar transport protein 20 n=1 Tax=Blattamonas nauphoetae TaxID=2049346 RepID=A0ABQ9YKU3_9EUKA|nr:putative intraflagellar transport protein 20 [Blattamonas nauphoetae]